MVLLYLRGLLHPGYPNGVTSKAREEFLLHCLAMEQAADIKKEQIMLQASFIPLFSPARARADVHHMFDSLARSAMLRGLQPRTDFSVAKGSVESMIKLYHALVKSKIIDDTK